MRKSRYLFALLGLVVAIDARWSQDATVPTQESQTQERMLRESPPPTNSGQTYNKVRDSRETIEPSDGLAEPTTLTQLQIEIKEQADRLHNFGPPDDVENEILRRAQLLTEAEMDSLESKVIQNSLPQDHRLISVYYLKQAGPKAHEHLQRILFKEFAGSSTTAKPLSIEDLERQFELNIRVLALLGIENNVYETRGRLKVRMSTGVEPQDTYLKGLLKIALLGEKVSRPLLRYFIQKSTTGESL